MDWSPVWSAGGFLLSMLGFTFLIVKLLDKKAEARQDRMEQRHKEEMSALHQEIIDNRYAVNVEMKELHSRVTDVKDQYVKQEVHDRDMMNLRESFTQFRTEIKQDLTQGIAQFNEGLSAMRKDFTDYLMQLTKHSKD